MKKILIVDDDKGMTQLLADIVKVGGHEPIIVNDSSLAMQTAISNKPDLFLLDLMMPEPNGFELCRLLRADIRFKSTPILIITAMDESDSKSIAFVAGANDYISKPFDPQELEKTIKGWMSKIS
ncbi:MAG: response regulator [Anaerolineales bacterium]